MAAGEKGREVKGSDEGPFEGHNVPKRGGSLTKWFGRPYTPPKGGKTSTTGKGDSAQSQKSYDCGKSSNLK